MTRMNWICTIAVTLALASFGCQAESPTRTDTEDLERETRKAVEAVRNYASQETAKFAQESEETIAHLEKRAEQWRDKAKNLSEGARAASRKELAELGAKAAEARKELEKLEGESGAAWTDLKKGAEAALKDLQKAYDRAASRFNDKG